MCRENGIKYSIAFGTLIGAIRHHGFIPWDDDIDIMMTRDNYEMFLKKYSVEKNKKYKILEKRYNPEYYHQFTKIVDTDTYVEERKLKKIDDMGVWVDVFPIDYMNSKNFKKKLFVLTFYQEGLHKAKGDIKKSDKNIILKFIKKTIFINHLNFWYNKTLKFVMKETYKRDNDIAGAILGDSLKKIMFNRELFDEYTDVEFEGHKIMAIKNYDYNLKKIYGDYMKIPNEHKIHDVDAYYKK